MQDSNHTPLAHQIPAACHRVGIGRTTLYELIKQGRIRTIKVGTRTLVPESELQRFISERLQASA
jgi:excisionase family DNA binding protein